MLPDEEPIFIFGYKENYRQGFLITSERILWNYDTFKGEWYFRDIGAIEIVKYMSMIDALVLFDKSISKYSSYIILTHLNNPQMFMFRFALFLYEVNYAGQNELGFGIDYILKYVAYSIDKTNDFIYRWKMTEPPKYYDEQTDSQKKFYEEYSERIKKDLPISELEKLYFATYIKGNHRDAYAITDYGLYYKNSNEIGCISWKDLKDCKIVGIDKHNFSINGVPLEVDSAVDKHLELLRNLKYAINSFWDSYFSKASMKLINNTPFTIKIEMLPHNISTSYENDTQNLQIYIGDIKFNHGSPLKIDRQVATMKEALNVDSKKACFFILPTTSYGKNAKGFIIAEDGFYYRNDNGGVGKISWNKYVEQDIYIDAFVYVGKNGFNVGLKLRDAIQNLLVGIKQYVKEL